MLAGTHGPPQAPIRWSARSSPPGSVTTSTGSTGSPGHLVADPGARDPQAALEAGELYAAIAAGE
jgi:hypothetical protein